MKTAIESSRRPETVACSYCGESISDYERLTAGHWWFWCERCHGRTKVPTPEFLERINSR